jgi:hypothetical protein
MASDQSPSGLPDTLDDELREDALDVLRDALQWRLTGPRWARVETAVEAVTSALRSGDVAALRTAVYELELAGPVRATGLGDTPVVDAPEPVREEINELIYTLDGRAAGE